MIERSSIGRIVAVIGSVVMAVSLLEGAPALAAGGQGVAAQANANPRVVPNQGSLYGDLASQWWQWAFSFPAADVPFFNTGGAVDLRAGQTGNVWFLAGANNGPATRTATVPSGTMLFVPMANLVNDYPCPDPSFQPDPGETLEQFLQRTGSPYLAYMTDLFAEVDGRPLTNLSAYANVSGIFTFTADPALAASFDPCIAGTPQPGVSVGYWLLLTPLAPGAHTLHFGSVGWGQDVTYLLEVAAGRGR